MKRFLLTYWSQLGAAIVLLLAIGGVKVDYSQVKGDVRALQTDVKEMDPPHIKASIDRIEATIARMEQRQIETADKIGDVKIEQVRVATNLANLMKK